MSYLLSDELQIENQKPLSVHSCNVTNTHLCFGCSYICFNHTGTVIASSLGNGCKLF